MRVPAKRLKARHITRRFGLRDLQFVLTNAAAVASAVPGMLDTLCEQWNLHSADVHYSTKFKCDIKDSDRLFVPFPVLT